MARSKLKKLTCASPSALLAISLCLAPVPAFACMPYEQVEKSIKQQHNETPIWRGVDTRGGRPVLFSAPDGKWTLVVIMPNGCSVPVASGVGGRLVGKGI